MNADGPEQRIAEADEEAQARAEYNDYLDSLEAEDGYLTSWGDQQLDRADFALDQARDAEWDGVVKQADLFDAFLDKLGPK